MQMAFDIIELRAYARAKHILDNAKSEKDVPVSGIIDQVWDIQAEIFKRKRQARLLAGR